MIEITGDTDLGIFDVRCVPESSSMSSIIERIFKFGFRGRAHGAGTRARWAYLRRRSTTDHTSPLRE